MKPKTVMRRTDTSREESAQKRPKAIQQGLRAGSIILTLDGEMAVEDLKAGSRVITRGSGMAIVRRVSMRRILTDTVRILAGSLGDKQPDRDVILLAEQKILIRDWRASAIYGNSDALVTVRDLIDNEFVTLEPDKSMTVFEIEFDTPQVLYVDGLEILSYDARFALAAAAAAA